MLALQTRSPASKAPMTDGIRIDSATANAALEPLSALDRIRWAVDALGDDVVLLSSMQKTAVVLMHLFHRLGLPTRCCSSTPATTSSRR